MTTRLMQWGMGAERSWQRIGGGWFGPLWLALVFLGSIWGFVELADDAPEGDYLVWENAVLQSLRSDGEPLGGETAVSAARDVTAMGGAVVLVVVTGLILGYLCLCGSYRVALLLAIATAGGQGLNLILKQSFARERPDATLRLVEVNSPSFPSGHSMAASIFYLTSGALLARTARRRREKVYLICCALLLTVAVGFSRVYLGVHYPTDVLAGWCAGAAWAILCLAVADGLARRGELRTAPAA
ncbi:MAG TPA: phosphatase PAP2 family protein [Opitutaceae bacterium]